VAWRVETAGSHESNYVAPLLDSARARGFDPETCALDMGYDNNRVYAECEDRDVRPIIPLRQTPDVKAGKAGPPSCDHGMWRFAGADAGRGAAKWRCPTGECRLRSPWVKANRLHPLVPRETPRWRKLYKGRASVEREFGRLKHDWALPRCEPVDWIVSRFTPTSRSSPNWRARSAAHDLCHSPPSPAAAGSCAVSAGSTSAGRAVEH